MIRSELNELKIKIFKYSESEINLASETFIYHSLIH